MAFDLSLRRRRQRRVRVDRRFGHAQPFRRAHRDHLPRKRRQAISDHGHAGRRRRRLRRALCRRQPHRAGAVQSAPLLHLRQCLWRRNDRRELRPGRRFAGPFGGRRFGVARQRRRYGGARHCGNADRAGLCGLRRVGGRRADRYGPRQGVRHERNADRGASRDVGVLSRQGQYRGRQCPESPAARPG